MSAQLLAVYTLIGLACAFVVRSTFRTWFAPTKAGCGSGCGKCAAPTPDRPPDATPTKRVGLPVVK